MIRRLALRVVVLLIVAALLRMLAIAGWAVVCEKWAANKTSESDLLAYLDHYPNGKYRRQVEAKLSKPAIQNHNQKLLEMLVQSSDSSIVDRCRPVLAEQLNKLVNPVLLDPLAAYRGKRLEVYLDCSGEEPEVYDGQIMEALTKGRLGQLFRRLGFEVVRVKSEDLAALVIKIKANQTGVSYRSIYDRAAAPVAGQYAIGQVLWQGQKIFDISAGTGTVAGDVARNTCSNWKQSLEYKVFPVGPRGQHF